MALLSCTNTSTVRGVSSNNSIAPRAARLRNLRKSSPAGQILSVPSADEPHGADPPGFFTRSTSRNLAQAALSRDASFGDNAETSSFNPNVALRFEIALRFFCLAEGAPSKRSAFFASSGCACCGEADFTPMQKVVNTGADGGWPGFWEKRRLPSDEVGRCDIQSGGRVRAWKNPDGAKRT